LGEAISQEIQVEQDGEGNAETGLQRMPGIEAATAKPVRALLQLIAQNPVVDTTIKSRG